MSKVKDILLQLVALLSLIATQPQRISTTTLLPRTVLEQLGPQFRRGRNFFGDLCHNGPAYWMRAVLNGRTMIPSAIAPSAWGQVSQLLLERRPLDVAFPSSSEYEVTQFRLQARLVSRHSVSYLLPSVDGYDDVRHFALHRMQDIAVVGDLLPLHGQFDVDNYIATGIPSHRQAGTQTDLIAAASAKIAVSLEDTRLSWRHSLEDVLRQHHSYQCAPTWVDEVALQLHNLHALFRLPGLYGRQSILANPAIQETIPRNTHG
ncbi:MAG: hypothetical protein ACRYF8_10220 [Janthinobacterium lividum]